MDENLYLFILKGVNISEKTIDNLGVLLAEQQIQLRKYIENPNRVSEDEDEGEGSWTDQDQSVEKDDE